MTDYNGHTTNYAYTARGELAKITYIAFTSPGAEAPPPSRGDLSVHSSGVCNAKTFPEKKIRAWNKKVRIGILPKAYPAKSPLEGGGASAPGDVYSRDDTGICLFRRIER